ncbi:arsenite efflux transporter metallochaperone ArsD [Alteribacillus sp. YIM 98480]|uniref:arsenite efflux transporter metallochaperone ArsD n=1 Tax=Alteribacillus sp. YIM 98480 TaxID=2606599 RepID=UPI00131CAFE5|nr:arsenite efflux transporter metallochaperone ArsD [Alteribacillus sp. YIM 98480]
MKLEIFDPALCCPTGVCGPDVDPALTRIASDLHILKNKGIDIHRYNLAQEPDPFVQKQDISKLMEEKGTDILPITMLDGEIVKSGEYPSRTELSEWLGISQETLQKGSKPSKVDISIN